MTDREEIQRALVVSAQIVARDGPAFLPVFERLEQELERFASQDGVLQRARRIATGREET